MPEILMELPFDEAETSPIAYDFSGNNNHAKVFDATFGTGREGYAIEFNGAEHAKAKSPLPDFSTDFTIVFWFKSETRLGYATPTGMLFQYAFDEDIENIKELSSPISLGVWQFWAIVKDTNEARIYRDGVLLGAIDFEGQIPTEFAVRQTDNSQGFTYTFPLSFGTAAAGYALGDMDRLVIYRGALLPDEIIDLMKPEERRYFWEIDGRPFTDWDVYVSDSNDVLDGLTAKDTGAVDWPDEHGLVENFKRPVWESREITLDCFIIGSGMLDFTMKFNEFLKQFKEPKIFPATTVGGPRQIQNYHRLACRIDRFKPLLWEVAHQTNTQLKKKWRNGDMVGEFKLVLKDNNPIRKVVRFTRTSEAGSMAWVCIRSTRTFNIYWGDGRYDEDVSPDGEQVYYHRFPKNGSYEIMICGDIDSIEYFNTNGIVAWSKL